MANLSGALSVREYPRSPRTDLKDLFRVYVTPTFIASLGIRPGDPCSLSLPGGFVRTVLVHPGTDSNLKDSVIQISRQLQTLYGIKLADKPFVSKTVAKVIDAGNIALCEVDLSEQKHTLPRLDPDEWPHWAWLLEYNLSRAEIVSSGLVLDGVESKGQKRAFKIQTINGSRDISLYRFQASSAVHVINGEISVSQLVISDTGVGGLGPQIAQLNRQIAKFEPQNPRDPLPKEFPQTPNGILLHGPSGTGKSLLLQRIGEAGWAGVFKLKIRQFSSPRIEDNDKAISKIFAEARRSEPSVIIIDSLEKFLGNSESAAPGLCETLCEQIDQLGDSRTVVVAACRSYTDINPIVRSTNCFPFVLEIPVPTLESRAEILKTFSGCPRYEPNPALDTLAAKTHSYVGNDLKLLLYLAADKVDDNQITSGKDVDIESSYPPVMARISPHELDVARRAVIPTAMREIFVETPNVRWDDIGGQDEVKRNLERALIWPSKYEDKGRNLGIKPRKGLLLYGPPGCSKTMIAQAAATELGHSFIAVKGAELLNMYVGESERAVRDLFRKARSVSPSIVFFDEIDAIGLSRNAGQHQGLNVVTTLLNELDGVEELKDVFVLAATNRPDVIDTALIRAGRLDTLLYVGPPDIKAREFILGKRMQKISIAEDVDKIALVNATEGFSGAELVKLCDKAAEAAFEDAVLRQKPATICHEHFDQILKKFRKIINPEMIKYFENFAARGQ